MSVLRFFSTNRGRLSQLQALTTLGGNYGLGNLKPRLAACVSNVTGFYRELLSLACLTGFVPYDDTSRRYLNKFVSANDNLSCTISPTVQVHLCNSLNAFCNVRAGQQVLLIRKFRNSVWSNLPNNVVRLIANYVALPLVPLQKVDYGRLVFRLVPSPNGDNKDVQK